MRDDTILSSKNAIRELEQSKEHGKMQIKKLPLTVFLIALVGVTLSMWGASWDITSHLLRTPETFFTPSHTILYLGVGISLISAILSLAVFAVKKQVRKEHYAFGMKIIIAGAIMQIIAGPSDFYWHELFGIDGLLSPTHITLALGIMIVSVGSIIGFARINSRTKEQNIFLKMILPVAFGIFWFSAMWMVFFFVLPISEGDTHNFNPDQHVAIILSFVALPFVFSIIFWSSFKTLNSFGSASTSALIFITMNITSNILTSENLLFYLPLFVAPITSAVIAECILRKKFKFKLIQNHSEKFAGVVMGSMFFMFSFPMLSMTFLEPYLFNDVFSYDILHTASNNVIEFWGLSIIPGAIVGMLGMIFASRKLDHISNSNPIIRSSKV